MISKFSFFFPLSYPFPNLMEEEERGKKSGRGAAVAAAHKAEKREEERGEKGRTTFGRVWSRWPYNFEEDPPDEGLVVFRSELMKRPTPPDSGEILNF